MHKSIYKQYISLLVLVPILISSISIGIGFFNYKMYKKDRDFIYFNEFLKIEHVIDNSFNYITKFSEIVGDKIAHLSEISPIFIGDILQKTYLIAQISQDIEPLTKFDFVSPEGKVIANVTDGALKTPPSVTKQDRSWMSLAPIEPWKLHISPTIVKGIVRRGQIVDYGIPTGFGITNNHGKFLGTISAGIDIQKLVNTINSVLNNDHIKFIILNKDLNLIADSSFKLNQNHLNEHKLKQLIGSSKHRFLKKAFKAGDIKYHFFQHLNQYPFIILIGENKYIEEKEIRERILPSIIFSVSIGGVLFLLFIFFRNKLVMPIKELSDIANSISSGKLNIKVPSYNDSEVSNLATQIKKVQNYTNEISNIKNELEVSRLELEKSHILLEQKVIERTQELESALNAKTEFLNNISHEIRTPIGGVSIISKELAENWGKFSEERRIELANAVATNAERLRLLVGSLLDLAKFSNGKMLLDLKKVDLNQLVYEMILEAEALYLQGKKINFVFDVMRPNNAIIDAERISQVLRNLFVNAIKFSPKCAHITIHITESEITYDDGLSIDALHFVITDQGIGIPEHELDVIFNQFIQSSNTKTKAGGTGLGLAICREIIAAHHGKIWAENVLGARFNFLIPKFQIKEMANHHIIHENNIEIVEHMNDLPANIIMIDDEETCLLSMELILSNTNYRLIKFDNGDNALKYLQSGAKVDLILLDLMMPDIYGLNVLSEIKHHNPSIPVILQTGSSDEQEIKRAFTIGVTGYIKKPYQKKLVLAAIRQSIME